MQTIQTLIVAVFLVTTAACSKQENTDASTQEPTIQKPMETAPANNAETEQAKPIVRLPNEIDASDLSGANVEQDGSGKKVLYWEDPMVPDRHFSKSGPSPFMDMKLEPKYAE